MTYMLLQGIEYERKYYKLHVDSSFAIFSTKCQYLRWVWILNIHFSTYPVGAKWCIKAPGVGSENIAYLVVTENANIEFL